MNEMSQNPYLVFNGHQFTGDESELWIPITDKDVLAHYRFVFNTFEDVLRKHLFPFRHLDDPSISEALKELAKEKQRMSLKHEENLGEKDGFCPIVLANAYQHDSHRSPEYQFSHLAGNVAVYFRIDLRKVKYVGNKGKWKPFHSMEAYTKLVEDESFRTGLELDSKESNLLLI